MLPVTADCSSTAAAALATCSRTVVTASRIAAIAAATLAEVAWMPSIWAVICSVARAA
jgi:hypothetical protein